MDKRFKLIKSILLIIVLFMVIFALPSQSYAFQDITETDWFFDNIMTMKERGIISGYPDNSFKPMNNVTHGESIKMVVMLSGAPVIEDTEFTVLEINQLGSDTHWSLPFIEAAYQGKILEFKDSGLDYDKKATRLETIEYIINYINTTVGSEIVPREIDLGSNKYSYFVDAYGEGMDFLYENDILKGNPTIDGPAFYGEKNITRAEFSAIINRAEDFVKGYLDGKPVNRVVRIYENPRTFSHDLAEVLENPFTIEDHVKIFYYLRFKNTKSITMKFSKENSERVIFENTVHPDLIAEIRRAYRIVTDTLPELDEIKNKIQIRAIIQGDGTTDIELELVAPILSYEETITRREVFNKKTITLAKEMVEDGKITPDMSQKDIAIFLNHWVVDLVEYDNYNIGRSHDGYSALIDNLTVCGGYTALYNRMLSLFGIEVYGVAGDAMNGVLHVWTEAFLDGELYYIDTTWNDTANTQKYFTKDKQVFLDTRSWNEDDLYNYRNIMQ